MDAVEFLEEQYRMCEALRSHCEECGLSYINNKTDLVCADFIKRHPEEAVAIVEKWAQEHPRKTRQSEFLKLFPNARIAVDGCIGGICPSDLDTEFVCPMQKRGSDYACCPECRRVYWHAEVKDNAD